MIQAVEQFISAEEYHSLPGVSNSRLSDFIEDPRLYWWKYLSGRYVAKRKDHFDFGSAVHDIALLGDSSGIVVYPAGVLGKDERRGTNAANAFEADNAGKIILKPSDHAKVISCVDAIFAHPIAGDLLRAAGPCERMYQYEDPDLELLLRCRPDKICHWNGKLIGFDLKTTTNTAPRKFAKSIVDFGYHRQEHFYRRVLKSCGVELDAFVFVAVRDEPPHCVDVYTLTEEFQKHGAIAVENALGGLAERTRANDWFPVSHNNIIAIDPPNFLKFASEYAL